MAFAQRTKVPIAKTRIEIEDLVTRAGATHFATFNEPEQAMIAFRMKDRNIRFKLPLPKKLNDQAQRSRWRALLLVIKAKLESVEGGIETLEEAFLAHIVTPGGRTVMEQIKEPLALQYSGQNVPLLPAFKGE